MTTASTFRDARTVLITGASSGAGRATARALAQRGARIVIVGHDLPRTRVAVDWLRRESGNPHVDLLLADLTCPQEVRDLVLAFRRGFGRLDVLINNAAVFSRDPRVGPGGFERTWALNHLARVELSLGLLPLLRVRGAGRIVNVSSWLYRRGRIDFDDLAGVSRGRGWRSYAQSQLATVSFSRALARRLAGTGVTVNSSHAGLIDSAFGRAAATPIHLAWAPEVAGMSGRHFVACRPTDPGGAAEDLELQERLWRFSLGQLGLGDVGLDAGIRATDATEGLRGSGVGGSEERLAVKKSQRSGPGVRVRPALDIVCLHGRKRQAEAESVFSRGDAEGDR